MSWNTTDDSFNTAVWGSGNTENTTSTANLGVAVDDSFNENNSTNDSGNEWMDVTDSYNEDNPV